MKTRKSDIEIQADEVESIGLKNLKINLLIQIISEPRSDNAILKILQKLDPVASYTGGVSRAGHRLISVFKHPDPVLQALKSYIDSGRVLSIIDEDVPDKTIWQWQSSK